MRGILVGYAVACCRRVEILGEHKATRFLQTMLLLERKGYLPL